MPIAVSCPSCSAAFSVKDEYAGKRAKCPQCKEPLTIPGVGDTVKMPPPAAATRPVVASKPKPMPVDDAPKPKRRRDEDDEPVRPTRKREAAADPDEEQPRSKRRRDEDAGDDAPRSKRRRRDDDEDKPKKKGSALPLILGIVGGVVLLCGGGCAGVWFLVIKPTGDKIQALGSELRKEREAREAFQANYRKVQAGMTKAQVDGLLGPNSVRPDEDDVSFATAGLPDEEEAERRWQAKNKLGHVLMWESDEHTVLVAFSDNPAAGGTVVGTVGSIGDDTTEAVKLAGGGSGLKSNPNPNPPQPPANNEITVTAEALAAEFDKDAKAAADKYKDKVLKVTGTLVEVDTQHGNFVKVKGGQPPATAKTITVVGYVAFAATGSVKRLKAGAPVTFTCRYDQFTQPKPNQPWELKLSDFKVAR